MMVWRAFYLLRASTAEGKSYTATLSEQKPCGKKERRVLAVSVMLLGQGQQ
jgi:hypothetical protein